MWRLTILVIFTAVILHAGCGGGDDDPITPPPPKPKEIEWTVMLYMGADNNLAPAALVDIQELEMVGSTDQVHFTVLADVYYEYSDYTTNYVYGIPDDSGYLVTPMMHITKHPEEGVQSHLTDPEAVLYPLEGFNSADPNNLKQFIKWSAQRFPAEHYALVIWDHGNSWLPGRAGAAAVQDMYEGEGNSMFIHEIEAAIFGSGIHLDILTFDACNMGSVEVIYQLKNVTDYVVASQRTEPGPGDDYEAIAAYLTANPTATPDALGKVWVNSFVEFYSLQDNSSVTRSLVKTDRLDAVASAVNQIVPLLADSSVITSDGLHSTMDEPIRFFRDVDIVNYTYVLPYHCQNPDLASKLESLREATFNSIIYNRTYTCDTEPVSWTFGTRDFGLGEDIDVLGATGLNIYLPTKSDYIENEFTYYTSTAFDLATGWSYVLNHAYEGAPFLNMVPGNWWAMLVWSTDVDLDLWVFEPDGYGGILPACPALGPTATNGFLSEDSLWTGISAESYMTFPEIVWGPYFFLGVYYQPSLSADDADCMLGLGADQYDENPLTSDIYYISATLPNDPDFGQGVVYFGFLLYDPDDGYWYFFEGERGGDVVRTSRKSEIGAELKSLKGDISKDVQPSLCFLSEEEIDQYQQQGLALAEELKEKLNSK